jgi:hypothetical protein
MDSEKQLLERALRGAVANLDAKARAVETCEAESRTISSLGRAMRGRPSQEDEQ